MQPHSSFRFLLPFRKHLYYSVNVMKSVSILAFCLLTFPAFSSPEALCDAVKKGNKEMVRRVLTNTKNVNFHSRNGSTPLVLAIEKGNEEVIGRLFSKGAEVNFADLNGVTPLLKAAEKNNTPLAKMLIGKKANVNTRNSEGTTPLFYYAENGNKEMVNLLLSKKATANIVNQKGESPLQLAMSKNHTGVVQLLYPGISFDTPNNPITPLMFASYAGDIKQVQALLSSGAEADQTNTFNETALYYAVIRRNEKIAQLLIDHGASAKDSKISRQLYPLCRNNKKNFAKMLVAAGANVNQGEHYGWTALRAAALDKDIELIRFLLEHGANPNSRDVEGYTPFMTIANSGSTEGMQLMLNGAGVNINEKNNHGHTALSLAVAAKAPLKMIQLLLDAGFSPVVGNPGSKGDAIHQATKARYAAARQLMEKAGK